MYNYSQEEFRHKVLSDDKVYMYIPPQILYSGIHWDSGFQASILWTLGDSLFTLDPYLDDMHRSLLGDAGLHVMGAESGGGLDMHDLQQVLSDKMHLDSDAAASFVAGLHLYMDDDPYKARPILFCRLQQPLRKPTPIEYLDYCIWVVTSVRQG